HTGYFPLVKLRSIHKRINNQYNKQGRSRNLFLKSHFFYVVFTIPNQLIYSYPLALSSGRKIIISLKFVFL
ncbi:MAG: hypothetical protein ACXWV8_12555, partial [Chitinophagaceae bacterium]